MSGIEELADKLRDLKYDYDSMSTSLEDAIDGIADEVEKLQDENERLRSCLSDSAENAKQIMHEAHVQEAENAKLRMLLAELYQCSRQCGCNHCGYKDWCAISNRMRELVIEVDE